MLDILKSIIISLVATFIIMISMGYIIENTNNVTDVSFYSVLLGLCVGYLTTFIFALVKK